MKVNDENPEITNKGKTELENHQNNEQDNNSTYTSLTGVNMVENKTNPEQFNELDKTSVNTTLTGMTMQAEENANGHKHQEEGNLSDNTSLMGMAIGEKETNGGPNALANIVEKTNDLTLTAQKSNKLDDQTVLSGLTIDAPHTNKNQESDQGAMESSSNRPDFHQGGAN
eukprot:15135806-Ditylum_brightwellii.AAC.1